ncbi:MAG: hypothetical protein WC841_03425 [Candidatus Shapirobacteria bacterium]|jgi:hypothetical protein
MKKEELITIFEKRLKQSEREREKYSLEIGLADGPMESAGISVSRWIIEDRAEMAGKEVERWKKAIKEISQIEIKTDFEKIEVGANLVLVWPNRKKEILVTKEIEDFELGLLPSTNPLVKEIINQKVGFEFQNQGEKIRIEGL